MSSHVNGDLQKERDSATFSRDDLTHLLDGGSQRTIRRRLIQNLVGSDPELATHEEGHYITDRDSMINASMRKYAACFQRIMEHGLTDEEDILLFQRAVFPNEQPSGIVHISMFIPTLLKQTTADQRKRWLTKAYQHVLIGTYAQTELGHGTFLKGLETTATYDKTTQEFVINSPSLSSTKWWVGGLGKTANVAIVGAQLHIDDTNHGIHFFFVPLRDLETHETLPGLTLGDIGPKFGFNMSDNGFARFDHVRIPRCNMLMRHSVVKPDGSYERGTRHKLKFGAMTYTRVYMVKHYAAEPLAQACMIAIRYSVIRRQSQLMPDTRESQILDFQTQQAKLFFALATAYAFWFAGSNLYNQYLVYSERINEGLVDGDAIAEMHALSSGLKAFTSENACKQIEVCRLACGGHGYSQASGFPKIYVSAVMACTAEGENTVLYKQVAAFLIKMYDRAINGGTTTPSTEYMCRLYRGGDLLDNVGELTPANISTVFQHRAFRKVRQTAGKLSQLSAHGLEVHDAWNLTSVELVGMSQAHILYVIVDRFVKTIVGLNGARNASIKIVLTELCQLYATHVMVQDSGDFLQNGLITTDMLAMISQKELALLAVLRPNAVALADAFDFPDFMLQSVLGRQDGCVYEALYKWAANSPLNEVDVHESFHKYIRPLQKSML